MCAGIKNLSISHHKFEVTQSGFYISTTLNVYSAHTGMDEIIDAVKDTTFCLEESGGKFQ